MIPQREIMEAAKEAGLDDWWDSGSEDKDTFNEIQIRFAAIIERKTIERCESALDKVMVTDHSLNTFKRCKAAIRKLGDE